MSYMDARDFGSKPGSGGVAGGGADGASRRERLRKLALETIDLARDPYLLRNHTGQYECRLCLTLHGNEGSYLAHTQGKKHQQNLAKRAAREAADANAGAALAAKRPRIQPRRTVKIGRPGYRVTKQFDARAGQRSLLFQVELPEIEAGLKPRHRFMSSYEQKVEPWDKRFQYFLVAAEPYETIAFKIPNIEVDRAPAHLHVHWEPDKKVYTVQIYLKGGVRGGAGPTLVRAPSEVGPGGGMGAPEDPGRPAGQGGAAGPSGPPGMPPGVPPGAPPPGMRPPPGVPGGPPAWAGRPSMPPQPPGMMPPPPSQGMPPPGMPPPGMLPHGMPPPGMLPPGMPPPGMPPPGMPPPGMPPPGMPPPGMPPPGMPPRGMPPPGMPPPGMLPPQQQGGAPPPLGMMPRRGA